jgi:hypothetical protein
MTIYEKIPGAVVALGGAVVPLNPRCGTTIDEDGSTDRG